MADEEKREVEFSKRIRTDKGYKSMEVEKVENGYIVEIREETNEPYSYSCKKYISATNPLKRENKILSLKEFLAES